MQNYIGFRMTRAFYTRFGKKIRSKSGIVRSEQITCQSEVKFNKNGRM